MIKRGELIPVRGSGQMGESKYEEGTSKPERERIRVEQADTEATKIAGA